MIIPPSLKFIGDKDRAQSLAPQARNKYYEISRFAEIADIPAMNRTLPFPDGSSIQVFTNLDEISGNRTGFCLIKGVSQPTIKKEEGLSFIWLSSSLSMGRLVPYFSHPTPKQEWLSLDAKETNYSKTSKKTFKFGSSWWKDVSSLNNWTSSCTWNNDSVSVVVAPIVFQNSTESTYYGNTSSPSVDISRLYLNSSLDWTSSTTPVVGLGVYVGKKIYILQNSSSVLYNLNTAKCVSISKGKVYFVYNQLGSASVFLRVYTLIDIPTASSDIYGTSSYVEYTLPITLPTSGNTVTNLLFSDINSTDLFIVVKDPPVSSNTFFTFYKVSLTSLTSITLSTLFTSSTYPGTSYIQNLICYNGKLTGIVYNIVSGSPVILSFKDTISGFIFSDITSTLPSNTNILLYANPIRGEYVVNSGIIISGIPGIKWSVIINGTTLYTRDIPYPSIFTTNPIRDSWFSVSHVSSPINTPQLATRPGSYARYKDRVVVAMRDFDKEDTSLAPYFLDINNGVVTEIPQSISGMHSQIYLI